MTRQPVTPERGQMQAKNAPPKPVVQDRMTSPPAENWALGHGAVEPEPLTTYTVEYLMTNTLGPICSECIPTESSGWYCHGAPCPGMPTAPTQIATYTVEHRMTVTRIDGAQWCATHHGVRNEDEDDCDMNDPEDPDRNACTLTDLYTETPAP